MARVGVLRTIEGGRVGFHCPGCNEAHVIAVDRARPQRNGAVWGFNGDYERPTFTPSVLMRRTDYEPAVTAENIDEWRRAPWPQSPVERVCHSFVTDGQIQFLGDCTHALAGQTVPLTAHEG